MRKVYLLAAVAATVLASCSSKDSLDTSQPVSQAPLEEGAVGFDAYTQRSTTRSGQSGVMDLTALRKSGFGVFGYYSDNNDYEQSRTPDFMYNQKVYDNTPSAVTASWMYEPVKYWPNEYGSTAVSDDNDRVSFFAYAPYVEVAPSSGKLVKSQSTDDQWGITGMSRNSAAGDPLVKYIANFEAAKRVDLMWGVCDDPQWAIVQTGSIQQSINDGEKGKPWLNVERPKDVDQRMKFTFKHALAQFSVNVDAFVDEFSNENNQLAAGTKIYVRQISFTGFAMKGALNLNNTEKDKALWLDYSGTTDIESGVPVVVYDGRKDGKEGMSGADASNEKVRGLNEDIISNYDESSNTGNTSEGVTAVTKPLFESTTPAMVIPTGEDMEVEIVYDVETEDANLSTRLSDGKTFGSSIENRISKTVSFGSAGMENGKHYTLNLHLGMNSVKFDAEVSAWEEATVKPEADLPLNMPSFTAIQNPSVTPVEITSASQNYHFAVYGLNAGEPVTATVVGATTGVLNGKTVNVASVADFTGEAATNGNANSSGVAYIRLSTNIGENQTVSDIPQDGYISVVGGTSGKEVRIGIKQLAHELGLGVASITSENTLNLTSTASGTTWSSLSPVVAVTVKKNGVPVAGTFTAASAGADIGTYVLPANVAAGDVYEITVKAGNAEEETFVANVGGIYFSPATRSLVYKNTGTYEAYAPSYYGTKPTAYSNVASSNVATATVADTDDATITTVGVNGGNPTVITVKSDQTNNLATHWYYTDATKTATYTLTVTKQAATISFGTPTPMAATVGTAFVVSSLQPTLKDASNAELTADGSLVDGGITYAFEDGGSNFEFDTTDQYKVKTKSSTPAGTYTVKVIATVADGANYSYATKTASYTMTVTINP